MKKAMLLWQAITPLHPGTGQDSASVIDLPVAREGATGFPMIPASTIKGVFRDGMGLRAGDEERLDADILQARSRYGFADRVGKQGSAQNGAGQLTFTDARLLGLPVPSFRGTFALVTSSLVLERLSRDRELLGFSRLTEVPAPSEGDPPTAIVSESTKLTFRGNIVLNDLDFQEQREGSLDALCIDLFGMAEAPRMQQRFCVVGDDVFSFLCATALEVTAHIRLDPDLKTVIDGALWYEETLPAESLLTSFLIGAGDELEVLRDRSWFQMGGKGTVGRGLLKLASFLEV